MNWKICIWLVGLGKVNWLIPEGQRDYTQVSIKAHCDATLFLFQSKRNISLTVATIFISERSIKDSRKSKTKKLVLARAEHSQEVRDNFYLRTTVLVVTVERNTEPFFCLSKERWYVIIVPSLPKGRWHVIIVPSFE